MSSGSAACPLCGFDQTTTFLRRERVPVHQHLVMRDETSAVGIARGDLEMAVCPRCGFVCNRAFDLSRLSYGAVYDNNQACSPSFRRHLDELAHYLVFERDVRNCRIVEVGCGDGTFLRKLVEAEGAGNSGYGFDPSYTGPLTDNDGRLRFVRDYYGPEHAEDVPADVIICRHVIEHVPDPLGLLHTIRQALIHSPQARVFFETPDVSWTLDNQVIWDFFYEHCSLFTPESLSMSFEAVGFTVESVRHVFGGQYLWLEATITQDSSAMTKTRDPNETVLLARRFVEAESVLRQTWEERVRSLAAKGKVALWGAGAKGVTFAHLVDPGRRLIDCLVDLNPQKVGGYVPGTGHPIVGYRELAQRNVSSAIVLNPNYLAENRVLLREAHLDDIELVAA